MQDTLMEQLQKTVEFAVEERARQFGPHYLDGFGPMDDENEEDDDDE